MTVLAVVEVQYLPTAALLLSLSRTWQSFYKSAAKHDQVIETGKCAGGFFEI